MKLYLRIVLAAAVVVSAGILTLGCRSIKIEPATIGTEGLRFYRPWPYLWVTSAAGKGCTTRVVWLPRTNQEYAIKTTGVLGSVTFKPVLTDGWNLTSFEGSADSKVP